jgi:hypothetical protein
MGVVVFRSCKMSTYANRQRDDHAGSAIDVECVIACFVRVVQGFELHSVHVQDTLHAGRDAPGKFLNFTGDRWRAVWDEFRNWLVANAA